jgi:hypothetical protein
MVFYHPIFDLSLYFWSFSAACSARSSQSTYAAVLKGNGFSRADERRKKMRL